jgi:hypothetical protein
MSPIESIECIARSEDRERAIIFFLFFARFEYALKRARFTRKNEGEAEADWDQYASSGAVANLVEKNNEERFKAAVALLKAEPPKKQFVNNGVLAWGPDGYKGPFNLARIFCLVRRVRNNLFHGGKFPEGPENDISRDQKLLGASIVVLQACLDFDEDLRHRFLEQLS